MSEPWRPWQPGDDPLALRYMTPEQVRELVERTRAQHDEPRMISAKARWKNDWLSDDAVVAIRAARAAGRKLRSIAAEYGVSEGTVCRIAKGQRYRYIPPSGVCSSEADPECSVRETVTSEGRV